MITLVSPLQHQSVSYGVSRTICIEGVCPLFCYENVPHFGPRPSLGGVTSFHVLTGK